MPATKEEEKMTVSESLKKLKSNKNYIHGVIAQAFYVGAQILCWTFMYQYVDRIEADAQKIGAINTIVKKNKKWIATNTDGLGGARYLPQIYF